MIHWHALRLWLRGARFHRIARRPDDDSVADDRPFVRHRFAPRTAGVAGRAFGCAADPVGRLTVVLPDGTRRVFGDAAAALEDQAQIEIHDREALVRLLVGGETGGGEAYMDGLWSSPDLAALLRLAARNRESLSLSCRLVPRPCSSAARSPTGRGATREEGRAGTSRPTTTWATTSTGLRRDADVLRSLRDARPDAC